jgi:hypothetical protein
MKRVIWFTFFLIMAMSCLDQPDCYRQNVNLMGISFRKMYDGKADTVIVYKAYSGDAVKDTLFYDSTRQATTALSVPLDYLKDHTSFTIKLDRVYDLQVNHKSKIQFVSTECGSRFVVSDLAIAGSTFDSIRLVSNTLSNPAHVNIEVYRCPRPYLMRFTFRQLFMDTLSAGKTEIHFINSIQTGDPAAAPVYPKLSLSSVLLPLNGDSSAIKFKFNIDDGVERFLKVSYQTDERQIFYQCGIQKLYSKLSLVATDFPLLKVAVDSIHDPPFTNIISYSCPTTNEIRVLFRHTSNSSKVTDTLRLTSLTANYLSDPIYSADTVTSVVLPLDPNASTTTYTFNRTSGITNTLTLSYTATPTTFHNVCGAQMVFTNIAVVSSDFATTAPITIIDPKAKFPAVNNIEILR